MKLSYRERIILIFAIVILILGIGIFVFIKPKYEKMKRNKQLLQDATEVWDNKLEGFARIPKRQKSINETYEKGLKISEGFTNEMTSVELDEFIQSFLNTEQYIDGKVRSKKELKVTDERTNTIGYYYYAPNIVTYPLYEAADLDGSLAAAAAEKLHDANIIGSRKSQTISGSDESFTVRIKREDLMTFLDTIEQYAREHSDAMLIKSVKIEDCDFNEDLEGGTGAEGEDGEDGDQAPQQKANANGDDKIKDYSEVTIEYKAYYIQEPMKPDVGPAYDATIWDGNEWRTKVAE